MAEGTMPHSHQEDIAYIYNICRQSLNLMCDDLSLLPFLLCLSKISYTVYIAEGEEPEPAAGLNPGIVLGLTKEAALPC